MDERALAVLMRRGEWMLVDAAHSVGSGRLLPPRSKAWPRSPANAAPTRPKRPAPLRGGPPELELGDKSYQGVNCGTATRTLELQERRRKRLADSGTFSSASAPSTGAACSRTDH
ncbi:hypothetical protein GCM10027174_21140 [Salinifilum aidingensis]